MPKTVVVELADREIHALWLERSQIFRRKLTPVRCDGIPLPTGVIRQGLLLDAERLTAALVDYTHSQGLQRRGRIPTVLILPWQQGFARGFRLPWFPRGKREQAFNYFVEEEIPIAGGEVLYDFRSVTDKPGEGSEIEVGAVRKSVLTEFTHCFSEAGFRIEGVNLAALAVSSVLPLQSEGDVLYLNEREQMLEMALFRGHRLEIVRTFSKPAGIAPDKEPLEELKRTLLYYATQNPDFALTRICCPSHEVLKELGERVRQNFGNSAELSPIAVQADFRGSKCQAVPEIAPAAYALSLQMRKSGTRLNLWRQEEKKRNAWHPVMLWGGVFLVLFVGILGYGWSLQARADRLEGELASLRPQGLKAESLFKKEKQLTEKWATLHSSPVSVGKSLALIGGLQIPGLTLTEIDYQGGGIHLHGLAGQAVQVVELLQRIKNQGWSSPLLSSYRQEEGRITFVLSARRP